MFVLLPRDKSFHFGKIDCLKKAMKQCDLDYSVEMSRSEIINAILDTLSFDQKKDQLLLFESAFESDHFIHFDHSIPMLDDIDEEKIDTLLHHILKVNVKDFWKGYNGNNFKILSVLFEESSGKMKNLISDQTKSKDFDKIFENIVSSSDSTHLKNFSKFFIKVMKKNLFQFLQPSHLRDLISACQKIEDSENSLQATFALYKDLFQCINKEFEDVCIEANGFWNLKSPTTLNKRKIDVAIVSPDHSTSKKKLKNPDFTPANGRKKNSKLIDKLKYDGDIEKDDGIKNDGNENDSIDTEEKNDDDTIFLKDLKKGTLEKAKKEAEETGKKLRFNVTIYFKDSPSGKDVRFKKVNNTDISSYI